MKGKKQAGKALVKSKKGGVIADYAKKAKASAQECGGIADNAKEAKAVAQELGWPQKAVEVLKPHVLGESEPGWERNGLAACDKWRSQYQGVADVAKSLQDITKANANAVVMRARDMLKKMPVGIDVGMADGYKWRTRFARLAEESKELAHSFDNLVGCYNPSIAKLPDGEFGWFTSKHEERCWRLRLQANEFGKNVDVAFTALLGDMSANATMKWAQATEEVTKAREVGDREWERSAADEVQRWVAKMEATNAEREKQLTAHFDARFDVLEAKADAAAKYSKDSAEGVKGVPRMVDDAREAWERPTEAALDVLNKLNLGETDRKIVCGIIKEGKTFTAIAKEVGLSQQAISLRWKKQIKQAYDKAGMVMPKIARGRRANVLKTSIRSKAKDGTTHWAHDKASFNDWNTPTHGL